MSFPRWFIYLMILMLSIPLLTGCSTVAMVGHGASLAVDKYCSVSASKRKIIRTAVASRLDPNSIQINCAEQ